MESITEWMQRFDAVEKMWFKGRRQTARTLLIRELAIEVPDHIDELTKMDRQAQWDFWRSFIGYYSTFGARLQQPGVFVSKLGKSADLFGQAISYNSQGFFEFGLTKDRTFIFFQGLRGESLPYFVAGIRKRLKQFLNGLDPTTTTEFGKGIAPVAGDFVLALGSEAGAMGGSFVTWGQGDLNGSRYTYLGANFLRGLGNHRKQFDAALKKQGYYDEFYKKLGKKESIAASLGEDRSYT